MAKRQFPPGLAVEFSKPLLAVSDKIRALEPWKRMSDVHLMGLRDNVTGELQIGCVLGTLGTLFAVVIYRHESGLRWVYEVATSGESEPDHDSGMEAMDYLKVEWITRRDLKKPDLETLSAAQYKPKGQGPIWPRFESCQPGWFPWFPTDTEAQSLTEHLKKVLRFVRLQARVPDVYFGHPQGEVPIIPAGDEDSLRQEDLEWLPLVLGPKPKPEPITLSAQEQAMLLKLPVKQDLVFEFAAPLMPEMSFWDEAARRPCLSRACLLIDQYSHFVFATELAHGPAPLHVALKPVLVKGLLEAKVRPGRILVCQETHAAVLRDACQALGVPVALVNRLDAAEEALSFLVEHFARTHA